MEPKSASGAPWEGENSLGNSPGGPPEVQHEFFSGSGGLRERFGSPPGGPNKDLMLRSLFFPLPGGSGERFWKHFGSILELFWSDFWSDFEVNLRLRWGLFSLLFFLVCFGFFALFVALRPVVFPRLLRDRAGEPRENRRKTLGERSQL